HSYMEREHHRISAASIGTGEPVEVLADHKPGSRACYARIVQVINPIEERAAAERARLRKAEAPAPRSSLFFTPRGDRTLAGMVVSMTAQLLTVRTRTGEISLHLRPDTRYLDEGIRTDPAALTVNTRVFVRAGRTIEGLIEAYQVMWGKILDVE